MLMMLLCRVGAWNGCCSAVAFRIPHTHIYVFYSICVQNRTYEIHESRYRKSGSLSSGSYSLLLCTRYQVSAVVCTGRHYILKLFCCRLHCAKSAGHHEARTTDPGSSPFPCIVHTQRKGCTHLSPFATHCTMVCGCVRPKLKRKNVMVILVLLCEYPLGVLTQQVRPRHVPKKQRQHKKCHS